jgi:hypothetical protein
MTTQDIIISALVALAVNLATPLTRGWIISFATGIRAKASMVSTKVLTRRRSQLQDDLKWYAEMQDVRKFIGWLFPHGFSQIIFLWVLVLFPYIINIISPIIGDYHTEALSKGGLYGLIGIGTRYFFSFCIVAAIAQKSISFADTEKSIKSQLKTLDSMLQSKGKNLTKAQS